MRLVHNGPACPRREVRLVVRDGRRLSLAGITPIWVHGQGVSTCSADSSRACNTPHEHVTHRREFEMTDAAFAGVACDAQNFSAVASGKWTCIKNKVRDKYGITINTDNWTASQDDFTFTWNYDSGVETLMMQCTRSPSMAACSAINDEVREIVRNCGV
jgi:hypothetical protein